MAPLEYTLTTTVPCGLRTKPVDCKYSGSSLMNAPVNSAVRYISAAAAAQIGGDLYEVLAVGDRVRLIIADVQGKGLPAVQTAAVVLGAFRGAAHDAPGLAEIADHVELSLKRQASEEKFVTAILAEITTGREGVGLVNCGHPPPLLVTGTRARFADPPEPGLPLGLAQFGPQGRKEYTIPFGPGDRMLLYTDGISEARDKTGAFYPVGHSASLLGGRIPKTCWRVCTPTSSGTPADRSGAESLRAAGALRVLGVRESLLGPGHARLGADKNQTSAAMGRPATVAVSRRSHGPHVRGRDRLAARRRGRSSG
jgi:hypothetical protein